MAKGHSVFVKPLLLLYNLLIICLLLAGDGYLTYAFYVS